METAPESERARTLSISVITTFLALIPTLYVALISNSSTLFADLLRCIVEFLAILVSFIVSKKTKPENLRNFHYGFGKLEHFASLAVAGAMLIAFIVVLLTALRRIFSPEPLQNAELGFALALLSVLGNSYIWYANTKILKRLFSPISLAQSRLFRAKTFASVVVATSLAAGIYLNDGVISLHADTIGAFAVAGLLIYSSYELIFRSFAEIVDSALEEGAQIIILKALVKFESLYSGIFRIRTRRGGNRDYIELWLEFDGALSLSAIQRSVEMIKNDITSQINAADVVIIPIAAHFKAASPS